jgi:hypothetical protein
VVANFFVTNLPPEILGIPEIIMMEDSPLQKTFNWLSQYILDPNDPLEALTYYFETGPYLEVKVDTTNQNMSIIPAENWYGSDTVFIQVTDPFGLSDADSFGVRVLAVNDPPQSFGLISPPNDTTVHEWFWPMTFNWEASSEVDQGDSILYTFYLSPSPSFIGEGTIAVSFLQDTVVMLNVQGDGVYYWAVWAEDLYHEKTRCEEVFKITVQSQTGIETITGLPDRYYLYQNYPNPFNPFTSLRYELPRDENVRLLIFNIRGALVRTLIDGRVQAGQHEIQWDGRDQWGSRVATGVYFVWFEAGNYIEKKKMLLIQ